MEYFNEMEVVFDSRSENEGQTVFFMDMRDGRPERSRSGAGLKKIRRPF